MIRNSGLLLLFASMGCALSEAMEYVLATHNGYSEVAEQRAARNRCCRAARPIGIACSLGRERHESATALAEVFVGAGSRHDNEVGAGLATEAAGHVLDLSQGKVFANPDVCHEPAAALAKSRGVAGYPAGSSSRPHRAIAAGRLARHDRRTCRHARPDRPDP